MGYESNLELVQDQRLGTILTQAGLAVSVTLSANMLGMPHAAADAPDQAAPREVPTESQRGPQTHTDRTPEDVPSPARDDKKQKTVITDYFLKVLQDIEEREMPAALIPLPPASQDHVPPAPTVPEHPAPPSIQHEPEQAAPNKTDQQSDSEPQPSNSASQRPGETTGHEDDPRVKALIPLPGPEWRPKVPDPSVVPASVPLPSVAIGNPDQIAPPPPAPSPAPAPAPLPPVEVAPPAIHGFEFIANPKAFRDDLYLAHEQKLSNIQVEMLPQHRPALDKFVRHYQDNKSRYIAIAERTNMPAPLIAALHWRESGGSFDRYMHNGELLGKPTTLVPAGKLFHNFEDSAVDALGDKVAYQIKYDLTMHSQDLAGMASYAERYNGTGYHNKGVPSPYVYSGTNMYDSGKYIKDGVYDHATVDQQLGVVLMISAVRSL